MRFADALEEWTAANRRARDAHLAGTCRDCGDLLEYRGWAIRQTNLCDRRRKRKHDRERKRREKTG